MITWQQFALVLAGVLLVEFVIVSRKIRRLGLVRRVFGLLKRLRDPEWGPQLRTRTAGLFERVAVLVLRGLFAAGRAVPRVIAAVARRVRYLWGRVRGALSRLRNRSDVGAV